MRILMAHNFYQHAGGEDQVLAAESLLLQQHGHTVIRLTRDYACLERMNRAAIAQASVWNQEVYREVRQIIRSEKVQLVHFHNTFPLISPAAYYAARAENVPVVQSLHNYRLLCPGGLFYREGRVCEDCLGRAIPWPGVMHGCYRGSTMQSGAVAGMLSVHRMMRTWSRAVDVYVALTEFARDKFVAGGLPEDKIRVKPNFMSVDPGPGTGEGGFALYVGRLTKDKGLEVLLEAWRRLRSTIPLKIVGDGPLAATLSEQVRELQQVELSGPRSREEVIELMKRASVLIVPSLWYEGFPMTIVEAYACGLPVIASDLGSLSSIVTNGQTGLLFQAGCADALAACVGDVLRKPAELDSMRRNARAAFERSYGAETGYSALMSIYDTAQQKHGMN